MKAAVRCSSPDCEAVFFLESTAAEIREALASPDGILSFARRTMAAVPAGWKVVVVSVRSFAEQGKLEVFAEKYESIYCPDHEPPRQRGGPMGPLEDA